MRSFTAGGDINPSRFVMHSTAADFTVLQAVADAFPVGISQEFPQDAPIPGASTLAGTAGRQMMVYAPSSGDDNASVVYLELGGTVARGARLMPDSAGRGITATTGKFYGAMALESGVSGELIKVAPMTGTQA